MVINLKQLLILAALNGIQKILATQDEKEEEELTSKSPAVSGQSTGLVVFLGFY